MRYLVAAAGMLWALKLAVVHGAEDPHQACAAQAPLAIAGPADVHVTVLCRPDAFLIVHDDEAHEPRAVEYTLTGDHSFGCVDRASFGFYRDPELPQTGARPVNYAKSGYDFGHMAPAQDGAWDQAVMKEFFTTANVAPQRPGLNRQEWERLEENGRAWAWTRGALVIVVGPIMGPSPERIGPDGVAVPAAFFKLVYDPRAREAMAFIMPQHDEPKGDLAPWRVSLDDLEQRSGLTITMPDGITSSGVLWPADLAAWHAEHKRRCHT
jgi:endonuclease G